jgi:diguanylate cyclase (GGDEF)-like protein/PAS domain S-box-containing protein
MKPGARLWLACVGALLLAFLVVPRNSLASSVLFFLVAALGTVTVGYAAASRRLWARPAWISLTLGMAVWTAAALVTAMAGAPTGPSQSQPGPSLLFLVAYLPITVAVGIFVREASRHEDVATVLDSLIVMTGGALVLLATVVQPTLNQLELSDTEVLEMASRVSLNLLLLGITVRLWFSTDRSTNQGVRLLSLALACLLFAAGWYQVAAAQAPGSEALAISDTAINVLYLAFFAVAGLAALDPQSTIVPTGLDGGASHGRARVLIVLAVSVLLPVLLLVIRPAQRSLLESGVLVALTVAIAVLLVFRIGLLVTGYSHALARERQLHDIGQKLTKAESVAAVESQLDDFARTLLGDPSATAVITDHDEAHADVLTAVMPLPASHTRYLRVHGKQPLSSEDRDALISLGTGLGMTYARLDLSSALITERAHARVESLLQHSSDVIAMLTASGHISYATPAAPAAVGRTVDEIVGHPWADWFTDPRQASRLLRRARTGDSVKGELIVARTDGSSGEFDVLVTWLPDQRNFVVTHHDVTERHDLQEKLQHQAFHDPLTGLYNRAVFHEELGRALRQARRSPAEFVVMMIDLDDFKTINDSLGHPAGDQLLCEVARRLVECLREGDIAARLGGDEFAVILERTWVPDDAANVAQRILDTLAEPVSLGSTDVVIGASIGVAIGDATTGDAEELQRNADLALYQAKYSGKDRYAVYEPAMHVDAVHRLKLTTELRKALDRGEIGVMYQPIYDLRNNEIVGLEALARWHHPERGLLPPVEFIGLAEETGLIQSLGRRVLEVALAEMAAWHRRYPAHRHTRIAVNMSGRQLGNPGIVDDLHEMLTGSGIDPAAVILEITEHVLTPGDGSASERMQRMADLGVSLYIDDFGTGWSSLNALRSLPVTGVKLAPEFVGRLPDPEENGFVEAVRDLAENLGLEAVVAEGLEHEDQRQALVEAGYRIGQGFLFGQPLKSEGAAELLRTTPAAPWVGPKGNSAIPRWGRSG